MTDDGIAQYKLQIMTVAFAGFLVATTKCSQKEAIERIATLCAAAEQHLLNQMSKTMAPSRLE